MKDLTEMQDPKNDAANKTVLENIIGGDPRLRKETAQNLINDLHARGVHEPAKVREILEKTIKINPHIVQYSTGAGGSYPTELKNHKSWRARIPASQGIRDGYEGIHRS